MRIRCDRGAPSAFAGDSGSLMSPKQRFDGGKFEPGPASVQRVANCKVLVIGAGGLGCELLKDLAMSGFKDVTVVDGDKIAIGHLTDNVLFRMNDISASKSKSGCFCSCWSVNIIVAIYFVATHVIFPSV